MDSDDAFIVRVRRWQPAGQGARRTRRAWRGRVQHVHSGECVYFQDAAGLLAFIERWTGALAEAGDEQKTDA